MNEENSDIVDWHKKQVRAILTHKKFNEDQRGRILFNFIVTQENRAASAAGTYAWLRTDSPPLFDAPRKAKQVRSYLYVASEKKLYVIAAKNIEFCAYLDQTYGLVLDRVTRRLIETLRIAAVGQGHRVQQNDAGGVVFPPV